MKKQTVLNLAYAEEEYCEKAQKYLDKFGVAVLYDKTNYAGSDNLTKYCYELHEAGLGHPNGWPWCMSWICWLYWKCYNTEIADQLLCGMLRSASTIDVKDAFLAKNRQVPLVKAEPGDIVFRSRSGGGHVGLVVGRSAEGKIITVEGNTSAKDKNSWNGGQVARHVGSTWEWCVRPDWSIIEETDDDDPGWHWCSWGGDWFYQDKNGRNWHGWLKVKESAGEFLHWYWFDNRGVMAKGAREIDGKMYYFQESGDLEGALCITDETGALVIWNLSE